MPPPSSPATHHNYNQHYMCDTTRQQITTDLDFRLQRSQFNEPSTSTFGVNATASGRNFCIQQFNEFSHPTLRSQDWHRLDNTFIYNDHS